MQMLRRSLENSGSWDGVEDLDVLVIDDEADPRQKWFRENLTGLGWKVASAHSSAEAYELLQARKFHLAFFDHDLGEEVTGSTIATRILMDPDTYKCPVAIWIHSANPVGAENIASKFRSARVPTRVCPFGELKSASHGTLRLLIGDLVSEGLADRCSTGHGKPGVVADVDPAGT